ncbi:hypothetical protein ACFL12_02725 [Pseudomonadota bacterium]
MANVLQIPSFNWKDIEQGLALCKAIQANAFDVVISISNVGRDDSYTILLLSDKAVSAQDVNLPCNELPSTQDLDTLVELTTAGTVQGLTNSIAKTGLSIHTDYPNIPGFEASYVDENCIEGFDPANPIIADIPNTVLLMDNIQNIGGDPTDVTVIIGFPNHPFNPLP